jgi:hypothetical protein
VPGCTDFSEGINALDLNGNIVWCKSFSGISRPVASPNGDALVHDFGVLYDFNPDGSLEWSFSFPFPSGTLIGPSVAPDGTVYIFHSYQNLGPSLRPDRSDGNRTDLLVLTSQSCPPFRPTAALLFSTQCILRGERKARRSKSVRRVGLVGASYHRPISRRRRASGFQRGRTNSLRHRSPKLAE